MAIFPPRERPEETGDAPFQPINLLVDITPPDLCEQLRLLEFEVFGGFKIEVEA